MSLLVDKLTNMLALQLTRDFKYTVPKKLDTQLNWANHICVHLITDDA